MGDRHGAATELPSAGPIVHDIHLPVPLGDPDRYDQQKRIQIQEAASSAVFAKESLSTFN